MFRPWIQGKLQGWRRTSREIASAIGSMQSGKSPGPYGYPTDFYKKFSGQFSPSLLSVESFSLRALPSTMRDAVQISLLLKKGKAPLECGSYRPISLLKTLARRLEGVLPSIILPNQTGFIESLFFFQHQTPFNILYSPSPPEVVLSLDAEKAFDRVEWGYLFSALERFGFVPRFISWVKLLYTALRAAVRTNNNVYTYFELKRGTRQGCPLSPMLFAIAMEPLAVALRQNTDIRGIWRARIEHKESLYVGDMLLFISQPLVSFPKLMVLLWAFGRISAYRSIFKKVN